MKKSILVARPGIIYLLFSFFTVSLQSHAYTLDEATAIAGNYGSGFGSLVGVYDGNSNLANVTTILHDEGLLDPGLTLQFLAKSDEPDPYFQYDTLYFKDNDPIEPVVGTWDYLNGVVDYLIVKASDQFALYAYNSAVAGGWSTLDIVKTFGNTSQPFFAMSHLTAISAVPLPAAAPLFLSALAIFGFGAYRRKRIRNGETPSN